MDGNYFIKLLDENTHAINQLCKEYRVYLHDDNADKNGDVNVKSNSINNEEIMGQLQTTIGKAQLLINQKFKQFRNLCHKNLKDKEPLPDGKELAVGEFVTRDDDLAGFWDMVCLQIDDIHKMFDFLNELRKNDWKLLEKVEEKPMTTTSTKTPNSRKSSTTPTTTPSTNKKIVNSNLALRKRILIEKQKKLSSSNNENSSESTTTTDANENGETANKPKELSKSDAARQRLLEAKRNAFLIKKKREAEEKLKQQEIDLENSDSISNSLNNTSISTNTTTTTTKNTNNTKNNQFFDISS